MQQYLNKRYWLALFSAIFFCMFSSAVFAEPASDEVTQIDRLQLVSEQIILLKSRYTQAKQELNLLQQQQDLQISQLTIQKASKNLLDKASLDVSVSKSNLESITIEVTDAEQTINWLDKNIQELENQLNVLRIFGLKVARNEVLDANALQVDLTYQQKLMTEEATRLDYLEKLQSTAKSILQLRKDRYVQLNSLLKSRRISNIKQEQVRDELVFQQEQNRWLLQLNDLYIKLAKVDPVKSKENYTELERKIFYTNESANYAYMQSLIARYRDQIQQMKLTILKSNSISLLNEISNQVQTLTKQIDRLDVALKSRAAVLDKHITYLSHKKKNVVGVSAYLANLASLQKRYLASDGLLVKLNQDLLIVRTSLDTALQIELSSRQGFPTFNLKNLVDLGKEILLVPALAFQVSKSLMTYIAKGIENTSLLGWFGFAFIQSVLVLIFFATRTMLSRLISRPTEDGRQQINTKWLSIKSLRRHLVDVMLLGNILIILSYFAVPLQAYIVIVYLSVVWLIFKVIMTVARLLLVETTHDTTGHDVRLYSRLKWIIFAGALITGVTVFVHQLPLIYEFKMLCDRLFLFILMIVSILLLRSWDVLPNLIISHVDSTHRYFQRSVKLVGILVPLLMLGNSVLGLLGFLNLVMTVCWYEGIFLLVLVGYLILRGLLSDGMMHLSRIMIQYTSNGWLWTEAFLKPIDKVLQIALFLTSWAVLFISYGWDKQSPIVERLMRLLDYKLVSVLNTTITPLSMIELFVVVSVFYWTAKWTREFVYRILANRTKDMGVRNSLAILSQYSVVLIGGFFCLRVLGIDLRALVAVAGLFAFGIGLGLRDLANNFACGFLILLERPLRVGDIVNINNFEGSVSHIGSRAVTVRTWDMMDVVVPNTEIFTKSFVNWTANDNTVRTIFHIKISRDDNPHEVKSIIANVLQNHKDVLRDPPPEIYLKEINDTLMDFELRFFVNIRLVKSRVSVTSSVLMTIWDTFALHGIKPPYPQQEIFLRRGSMPGVEMFSVNKSEGENPAANPA